MDNKVKAALIAGIFGIIVACIELLPWLFPGQTQPDQNNVINGNDNLNSNLNKQVVVQKTSYKMSLEQPVKSKNQEKNQIFQLVFLYYNKIEQDKILTLVKNIPELYIVEWNSSASEFDKSVEAKVKSIDLNNKKLWQIIKNRLKQTLPVAQSSCNQNYLLFKGYSHEK